jgi:hypothetical protein
MVFTAAKKFGDEFCNEKIYAILYNKEQSYYALCERRRDADECKTSQ